MDPHQNQQFGYPTMNNQGMQQYTMATPHIMQQHHQQQMSKKDKRRQQIYSRLGKLDEQFYNEKDFYYRESLVQLQYKLSTLHSGENPPYLQKVRDLEEERDSELVRLRLWEEYQVKMTEEIFKEDYEKAKEEKELILSKVRERLHETIVKKIKAVKDDKVLMAISPPSSSGSLGVTSRRRNGLHDAGNDSQDGYGSEAALLFPGERRSRRQTTKRFDPSNLASNHADDSYESGTGTGTAGGYASGSNSRRRGKQSGNASGHNKNDSSADDGPSSLNYFTDNKSLNEFLYGSEFVRKQEKANTRLSNKSYTTCAGLKVEEVNDDLALLRNSISAIQNHKKSAKYNNNNQ